MVETDEKGVHDSGWMSDTYSNAFDNVHRIIEKFGDNYHTVYIYNWNFNACKLANHFAGLVQDEQIKEMLNKVASMHKEHAKVVLNILS